MSEEKELEQQRDTNEVAFADNPDYLQEKSEIIANMKKVSDQDDSVLDGKPYSERYEIKKDRHISDIDQQLAEMRTRGDYGIPELDSEGNQIQADMDFIESGSSLPDELKSE